MAAAVMDGARRPLNSSNSELLADEGDPFIDNQPRTQNTQSHRYSSFFGSDSLHLDATSSPNQLKRTLQAHLSETDRRLQDTQRLGTSLLQQQQELSEKLKEVETQEDEAEVSPELRQRLAELEKEHNDVGKEIARALLAPKARAVSSEDRQGPDGSGVLSSQATASPSKVSVPNRKQRNQPTNRAHDVQFAADISTSLLAQVRQLQAALSERDESLKAVNLQNAKLEHDAEGFSQRLRALDENEQRYKDENWNLETQTHELIAASKEAAEREKRLNASLAATLAEKSRSQNDFDELTVAHGQLGEEHSAAQKAHDSELHSLRRTIDASHTERMTLQDRIDEITMQNQELAKAMAGRSRNRDLVGEGGLLIENDDLSRDLSTPDHSPPPSPTKGTPRHGGLESETLKSSLHHAHRMIQNLKGNIHREKTEKIELKRMLQDARDELEQRRADGTANGSGNKRQKPRSEVFKKPIRLDMLGGSRRTRTDVDLEEQDWEDHAGENSPSRVAASRHLGLMPNVGGNHSTDTSDAYQTANDTEGGFETARERDTTESEDFMTGAESLAGDSTDELTETEDSLGRVNTVRGPRSPLAHRNAGNRSSYMSTASTSAEEDDRDVQTPIQTQPQKYRVRVGRGTVFLQNRSRAGTTPESYHSQTVVRDSPAGFEGDQSPPTGEQSLFTELGGLNGIGADSQFGTPRSVSLVSHESTPTGSQSMRRDLAQPAVVMPSGAAMVDSGTMTEPSQAQASSMKLVGDAADAAGAAAAAAAGAMAGLAIHNNETAPVSPSQFPLPPSLQSSPMRADSGTQYTPLKLRHDSPSGSMPNFITPPKTLWDEVHDQQNGAIGVPASARETTQNSHSVLGLSNIFAQQTVPFHSTNSFTASHQPVLSYSSIQTQETVPRSSSHLASTSLPMTVDKRDQTELSHTRDDTVSDLAGVGLLASLGSTFGFTQPKPTFGPTFAEDTITADTERGDSDTDATRIPLKDVSGNSVLRKSLHGHKDFAERAVAEPGLVSRNDQSSQTVLTSQHIDQALLMATPNSQASPSQEPSPQTMLSQAALAPAPIISPRSGPRSKDRMSIEQGSSSRDVALSAPTSPYKRPSSSSSQQPVSTSSSHPPLPADHRTAIAKAGGRVQSHGEPQNSSHVSSLMGPPIAPASAYRRPRTPGDQTISVGSPTRGGTTPRASIRSQHRTGSQLSRRSSVSSFASELDERFNIRTDGSGMPQSQVFDAGPGTDPRMIQAITQTMIGEFLWKYTRKPGRPEMSSTRHRRYFWVHPYTRTLYWSDQDPQSAGRSQLKAKSVAIESVRVVSDDNPMPPGLHRKSLEVITPGRIVKFTASTGQRHETWFNALSYLLLRGQDATEVGAYSTGGVVVNDGGLTAEDVNEFNPGHGRAGQATTSSRLSMSSYNSRTTHGTIGNATDTRSGARQQLPPNIIPTAIPHASIASRSTVRQQSGDRLSRSREPDQGARKDSVSTRFSRMMGSMTSRSRTRSSGPGFDGVASGAPAGTHGSIYNASIVSEGGHDSAEELRKELLKQERDADRLENVRACCDGKHWPEDDKGSLTHQAGKHDVSTLASRGGRHHHTHVGQRTSQSLDRLSQSVNRRPVGTLMGE